MNSACFESRGCERQRVVHRHLPRLAPAHYQGRAFVHWTLAVQHRATGWLNPEFHTAWRFALLHASSRFQLVAPAYVLMPDHAHLLWLGLNERNSDQRPAVAFLRRCLACHLSPASWQRQPFDHVLRDDERGCGAFGAVAGYVVDNPVRAGLVGCWQEYPYLGCCVPGYPEFQIAAEDYWERFWRCYNYLVERMHT